MQVTLRVLVAALCVAYLVCQADAEGIKKASRGCVTASWGSKGNYSFPMPSSDVTWGHDGIVTVMLQPLKCTDLVGIDAAICGARKISFKDDITVVMEVDPRLPLADRTGVLIAVGHYVHSKQHGGCKV